jgi:hypothetical protein
MVNKKAMGSQGKEAVECRGSPLANAKEFSLQDQMKKSNAHIYWTSTKKTDILWAGCIAITIYCGSQESRSIYIKMNLNK